MIQRSKTFTNILFASKLKGCKIASLNSLKTILVDSEKAAKRMQKVRTERFVAVATI